MPDTDTSSPGDDTQRRQRAPHKKSNKGCGTCKDRHVKCDERQPTCIRCESAGRECKGYEAAPKRRKQAFAVRGFKMVSFESPPLPSSVSPPSSGPSPKSVVPSDETTALDYFTTHTLSLLSHTNPSKLWTETAPQLLESSPVLYQVAIALGATHLKLDIPEADASWDDRALRWYSGAVGALREAISQKPPDTTVIALASLLCILFESLQKRSSEMLIHLHNGVRYCFEDGVLRTRDENRDIAALLSRVGITSMLHNPTGAPAKETQEVMRNLRQQMGEMPEGSNTQKLSVDFSCVFGDTFEYLRGLKYNFYGDAANQMLAQLRLERRLEELLARLEDTTADRVPFPAEHWEFVTSLLRAYCLMCWIYAKACTSGYQTAYDRYTTTFDEIVEATERSLALLNAHPDAVTYGRLLFTFGYGHVVVLCLVIHQCRVPRIRQKALSLVKACPKRDGLWDADERYRACKALVDFEEKGANDFDENGIARSVPEEFRVHFYEYLSPDEGGLAIVVYTKPRRENQWVPQRIAC